MKKASPEGIEKEVGRVIVKIKESSLFKKFAEKHSFGALFRLEELDRITGRIIQNDLRSTDA